MKIILLQDIKALGRKGDVKNVADGYARNFLLPKKLAVVATDAAMKSVQLEKEKEVAGEKANLDKLRELARKLEGRKITLKSKEKEGKLFGSVTAKNIAEELQKENLEIPEKSIIIKEAIKKIGEYAIRIELAPKIDANIKLKVAGEK